MIGNGEPAMVSQIQVGDVIGLLPITPNPKGYEKGRVYCAHVTLMTELKVSLSSSQHGSHTFQKEGEGRKDK